MTALNTYPAVDFNTFTDVAGADTLASDSLSHELWDGLSVEDKQRWLLFTGRMFIDLEGFAPEAPQDACLAASQILVVLHQMKNGLQEEKSQQHRVRKFDVMYEEYFKNDYADLSVVNDLPAEVRACLEANGAKLDTNTFGGVGTVRRHR